ncbi:DNA cytosine methyltransferase [Achromobacter xylosoxidans]|uniref:DNA cytosine methyltransferase n=1 Tax=Alcaligenes xylosoxydans xylosoxydans TaxID=85698 RepID=UPI001F058263|nr:DNA cytosine methyltransferase [Achromobacter xylosoxidans]MCH1990024.1 DNA cytosine methyltransferase [Achromobacter xylosoxidans]MCH1995441.1 DNA cytosine methyltransferase [Achromobacter xylosoxidans]MCH4589377.1 DNA cytosine methyltransferase [Achromobacter xylosoxidans]
MHNIEAIDLFCGAGGLTYGLQKQKIRVLAGIDIDPACKYPYERNNATRFILEDVKDIESEDLAAMFSDGAVRLLAGCAPCQPFSSMRRGADTSQDQKWGLLEHFSRLVEDIRPELVTMENVPRVVNHGPFIAFRDKLVELGYHVDFRVVQCADFGLPQFRRRCVLMASKLGSITVPSGTGKKKSALAAIEGLPALKHGESSKADPLHRSRSLTSINAKRAKTAKAGGSWADWPEDLRLECHKRETGASFKSVYGRMQADKPAPTITTQFFNIGTGRFIHPNQDRGISLREGAILQSFPKKYRFAKNDSEISFAVTGRLIGNAVPPLLGQFIGKSFLSHVKDAYRGE